MPPSSSRMVAPAEAAAPVAVCPPRVCDDDDGPGAWLASEMGGVCCARDDGPGRTAALGEVGSPAQVLYVGDVVSAVVRSDAQVVEPRRRGARARSGTVAPEPMRCSGRGGPNPRSGPALRVGPLRETGGARRVPDPLDLRGSRVLAVECCGDGRSCRRGPVSTRPRTSPPSASISA